MRALDPVDQAVETEPPEVVRHLALGEGGWVDAQQLRKAGADVVVGETLGLEDESEDGCEEGLNTRIIERQAGCSVAVDDDRTDHLTVKRDHAVRRCTLWKAA